MRGYFVRDFYAKAVALVGLGVLAGAGAMVDSWPSGVDLPATGLIAETSSSVLTMAMRGPAASSTPPDKHALRARPRTFAAPPLLALAVVETRRLFEVRAVELEPPPPPTLAVAPTSDALFAAGEPVMIQALFAPVDAPPAQAPGVRSDDGFLTAALKKTGSSIVAIGSLGAKTGAKTGASIVGAARAVGGAVRRVLPL